MNCLCGEPATVNGKCDECARITRDFANEWRKQRKVTRGMHQWRKRMYRGKNGYLHRWQTYKQENTK